MSRLFDSFNRQVEYLRIAVTDRCDLRCSYCLPKGYKGATEPKSWLSPEELERLVGAFVRLGVTRVRLTGGEPLVRRALPEIAERLGALPGVNDLALSTNATRLERHAERLRDAGISRVNVSLDTLNPTLFRELTGNGDLNAVLRGLDAAAEANLRPVKVNMVVMRGVNDHEAGELLRFCMERDFTLRFIETMPMGNTGREASNRYLDLNEVVKRLSTEFSLLPALDTGHGGPARYYRVNGSRTTIGLITPLSQHFCDTCNRVRLGPDGRLYLCLGGEDSVDLGSVVRSESSDETLEAAIVAAIQRKPERHHFNESPGQVVRFMGVTGG